MQRVLVIQCFICKVSKLKQMSFCVVVLRLVWAQAGRPLQPAAQALPAPALPAPQLFVPSVPAGVSTLHLAYEAVIK